MESYREWPRTNSETGPEYWVERPNVPLDRGFFELQFEFARSLAARNERDLLEVIGSVAPALDRHIMEQASNGRMELRDGVTEETVVDVAYDTYMEWNGFLDPEKAARTIPYHNKNRYGCFSHTYDDSSKTAFIHFVNAEHGSAGPLAKENMPHREHEMRDVLLNIKRSHPDVEKMMNRSWLLNLEAYRRLYPQQYIDNREVTEEARLWRLGTTIWGQFLDSELKVKQDLAEILLERARTIAISKDAPTGLLEAPLMKPMRVEGPIELFYDKYGIE